MILGAMTFERNSFQWLTKTVLRVFALGFLSKRVCQWVCECFWNKNLKQFWFLYIFSEAS